VALIDVSKGSFTSGELSVRMFSRPEVDRYRNGAAILENWRVLTQGGVTRREGLRHVALCKYANRLTLLKPFEPSTTDAYILEVGHEYIRFYLNSARLEAPPGTALEIPTPYQDTDLRLLRTAQSNDVMIFVHGGYTPVRLARLTPSSFAFQDISFLPPPTYEAGYKQGTALTLSATTGSGVTVTATSGVFLKADTQRQLSHGVGRGVITEVVDSQNAVMTIHDAFASTALPAAEWTLRGSPVATATPSDTGPTGAEITITLGAERADLANLVSNGDFATGDLTGWSNFSSPVVTTGTHTGANNSASLIDTANDFLVAGVQPTQIIINGSDGSQGTVAGISTSTLTVAAPGLIGGVDNDFDTGDNYTIVATGSAAVSGGTALLTGGTAGVGWIEQAITTVANQRYRLTFIVADGSVGVQLGATSQLADVESERSYGAGDREVFFTATGTTTYLQFRNNQAATIKVGSIVVKAYSIDGFRSGEVGRYIVINGGIVRITSLTATSATGEVIKELTTDTPSVAGAWTLEASQWSDELGWPGTVVFYEGRLYFGGSLSFPQTIWGSVIDDFFNFAGGDTARDAVKLSLVDSGGNITLNRLRWLMPAENMLVSTTHGEYRLIGSGDDPLSPITPPRNRIQSTFGTDAVQPLKVGEAVLFAQRQGSKLREIAFEASTNTRFVARDITVTSEHLLRRYKILELAYQQEPVSTVYGVRSDGQLLAMTYDLSEQVAAWYRLVTAGQFESCATIPFPARNAHQVWVTVLRDGVRSVEYFDPYAEMHLRTAVETENELTGEDEIWETWEGLTVDAGVVYNGVATTTLTGLAHLNGVACRVVADGAVLPGSYTPSGGSLTLPYAVESAFVGRPFIARGRALPVAMPNQSVELLQKRFVTIRIRMENTLSLVVQDEPVFFRTPSMAMDQGAAPFTGDKEVHPLGWDELAILEFRSDQPLPATVLGLFGTLNVNAGER